MSINTLARVFTPHGNIVYTANDFRQTLRIAVAGTVALSISTFYDVQYGVFFVVYPLMLLSLVPVFNRHVARQFIFSAAVKLRGNGADRRLSVAVAGDYDAGGLRPLRDALSFYEPGPLFLLGSMGVVCQSTMLNFMSYPTSNWHTLMFSNIEACVMAVALSALLNYLIPDVEPRQPPPRIEKDAARIRHESLLSGSVATMIFVVFQICDLSDSLSALMAGILILFPMHYRGAVISSIWRVVGVVLACLYILVVQLLIYDFSNHMVLMMPLIALGLAFSARLHVMEKVGAGVGFASITTIGIMFGQNLHPDQDLNLQRSVPDKLGHYLAYRHPDAGVSRPPHPKLLCGRRGSLLANRNQAGKVRYSATLRRRSDKSPPWRRE
ncbi:Protein of uncharacterised function (DUF2955) [Raoultella terrigena]|uniref:Protein of uncharacterized function (DUF2955) n=1 Tax=Raoultella terrigena TaxID=577 RepID=A0A4V6J2F0_RAOTE|nr:Protein of uncharacterised function (DUF2955) [Raoultella terrigena]